MQIWSAPISRFVLVPAAALLLAGFAPALCADAPAVRIVSPSSVDTLLGKTEIVVAVEAPAGVSILKVELYADDRLITTLLDPPYHFMWDAGDSLKSRTLRAKAYAGNGATASDKVITRALPGVQRARVTLVEVYATVRDSRGVYMTDLTKDDFTVIESGARQEIAVFSAERKPAHIVLLVDASASMGREGRLTIAQEAAVGFIEAMDAADTAAIATFNDTARILKERTSDKQALEAGILSIEAKGGTALYDALVAGVELLKGIEGRKALILLSDGRDESSDGLGPGSAASFEQALEAILKSETAVYAIGTGEGLAEEFDYDHRRTVGQILEEIALHSGGRSYLVKKASRLKEAYRLIEDELRHQYTLAYYPPTETAGAKSGFPGWRPIEVRVARPKARVTARAGYYAK
jgi:VWFA-related protein